MLKKLLRHDIAATGRILLPFYGLIFILAAFLRLFDFLIEVTLDEGLFFSLISLLYGFFIFAYVFATVSSFALTFFFGIQRYYYSINKNEAYLMFTLPVPRYYNIITKVINSLMWQVLSILTVCSSLLIVFYEPGLFDKIWLYIKNFFGILEAIDTPTVIFLIEVVVLIIVALIQLTLLIMAAISIGHVISKRRLLGSIGGYFMLNIASQIVSVISLYIFLAVTGLSEVALDQVNSMAYAIGIMGYSIVITSIMAVAYFFVSNYIIRNHLNLEG